MTITASVRVHGNSDEVTKNLSLQPIPKPSAIQDLSITLNWGTFPSDLDAHMIYQPFKKGKKAKKTTLTSHLSSGTQMAKHFSWMNKGNAKEAPYVTLDHDDMNGKGPETITLHKLIDGEFKYYVKCFSCPPFGASAGLDMSKSLAAVTATQGGKQLRLALTSAQSTLEYTINHNAAGKPHRIWNVLSFVVRNGKARMVPHLKYVANEPSFTGGEEVAEQLLATKLKSAQAALKLKSAQAALTINSSRSPYQDELRSMERYAVDLPPRSKAPTAGHSAGIDKFEATEGESGVEMMMDAPENGV